MPHPLVEKVERLTRRLRVRGWLTGVTWLATAALGVAAVLVGLDYATRWSDAGVRWIATGAWLVGVGWAVDRFVLRPRGAAERPRFEQVAQRVEQRYPKLGSRLTSSLAFLGQSEEDTAAGSAELRRAVISQSTADLEQIDLAETVDPAPLRRAAAWLGGLAAAVAVAAFVNPAAVATGVTRLAAPWSDADWPRRHQLAFVDPPARLARGSDFEATLVDKNGAPPADTQIVYRLETPAGQRTEQRAAEPSGGELIAVFENVQQSFAFRAVGGDDYTMAWSRVEVVDPPGVERLTITAAPPAYTGLPPADVGPDIRVLEGTGLSLSGVADAALATATLIIGDEARVPLDVAPAENSEGDAETSLRLDPGVWIAALPLSDGDTPSTADYQAEYHIELVGADGITGRTKTHRYRVDRDPPPEPRWVAPSTDQFVTARAVVPLEIIAEDNLAIGKMRIAITQVTSDPLSDTPPTAPADGLPPLVLFEGPLDPPTPANGSAGEGAVGGSDTRAASLDWELEPLGLAVGDTLELVGEAEDYHPAVGRTPAPRRVTMISDEEFNQRLADGQSLLLSNLRRALSAERDARAKTREATDSTADADGLLDQLATLAFDQRRVAELVDDPERGIGEQAEQLLGELTQNRVDRPGLASQLRRIADAARRLGKGPLPEASRAIADARRSAEAGRSSEAGRSTETRDAGKRMAESLAAADRQQTDVVDTLDRLADEMAEWSDLEQFAGELADLEQKQRDLRKATAADAAKSAAAARTPAARAADRQRLADGQAELGRRFDKLMRAMQRRLDAAPNPGGPGGDESAEQQALAPLADTLAESEDRATTGKLRDATRQIRDGRLGRAGDAQQQAIEDLQELLSTLRNRASSDPAQLAEQLKKAQQRLAELRKRVEQLEREAADPRQQAANEQRAADRADRLSRQLERLTAEDAADSAEGGADQLADAAQQSQSGQQQGGARQSRAQAEEQLRRAEQQLAQRIQQLENEAAQRLLDQLAADVRAYLERQRLLLEQTVELSDSTPIGVAGQSEPSDTDIARQSRSLAGDQRGLGDKVDGSSEKIAERKVFSLALESAANEMQSAAERLAAVDPGRATQQHELAAIERLKHIADALTPTPPDDQEQPPSEGQGGGGQQGQPREPPPFDVAELKMLRLLQLDLNARTRRFEAENAAGRLASDAPRDATRDAARALADEQRRLADLVQELLDRNNKDPRLAPPPEVF